MKKGILRGIQRVTAAAAAVAVFVGSVPEIGVYLPHSAEILAYSDGYVTVGSIKYQLYDTGEAYVHGYDGSDTDLEILSEVTGEDGEKYKVKSINSRAFLNNTEITSVIIPDSVYGIGTSAFEGCTSLTEITLPTVEKDPSHGSYLNNYVFRYCTGLKSVTLSNINVTSYANEYDYIYIGTIFDGCTGIQEYHLKDVDGFKEVDGVIYSEDGNTLELVPPARTVFEIPDTVTEISDNAFHSSAIESVTIPGNIKEVKGFPYCENLKSVRIEKGAEKIGDYAFSDCTALNDVIIPESVVSIGSDAFRLCKSLESILLPYSVETIDWSAFAGCTSLQYASLSNGITEIGPYAFSGCVSIKLITLPETLEKLGAHAFKNCIGLSRLRIPASVTEIGGNPISSTPDDYWYLKDYDGDLNMKIEKIEVAPENMNYKSIDGVLYDKNVTEIIAYPQGKEDTVFELPSTVTKIGDYTFSNCDNLEKIHFSKNVTEIGEKRETYILFDSQYVFADCDNLTEISYLTDEGKVPEHIKSIELSSFNNCKSLSTISIPSCATKIYCGELIGCTSLTSVTIPENVSILLYYYPFKDGSGGASPPFTGSKLRTIYGYKGSFAEYYADTTDNVGFVSIGDATNIPVILETRTYYEQYNKPETLEAIQILLGRVFNATEYKVYRSETPNGNKTLIKTLKQIPYEDSDNHDVNNSPDYFLYFVYRHQAPFFRENDEWGLSFKDKDVKPGKTYYYFATSVTEDGTESDYSDYYMVSTGGSAPPEPEPTPTDAYFSGEFKNYDPSAGSMTVTLSDKYGEIEEYVSDDGKYSFTYAQPGVEYTLEFSINGYIPRTYTKTAEKTSVTIDPVLRMNGDITGDNDIRSCDATQVLRYDAGLTCMIRDKNGVRDKYLMKVGSVTGGAEPTAKDATQMLRCEAGLPNMIRDVQ